MLPLIFTLFKFLNQSSLQFQEFDRRLSFPLLVQTALMTIAVHNNI